MSQRRREIRAALLRYPDGRQTVELVTNDTTVSDAPIPIGRIEFATDELSGVMSALIGIADAFLESRR